MKSILLFNNLIDASKLCIVIQIFHIIYFLLEMCREKYTILKTIMYCVSFKIEDARKNSLSSISRHIIREIKLSLFNLRFNQIHRKQILQSVCEVYRHKCNRICQQHIDRRKKTPFNRNFMYVTVNDFI